MDLSYEETMRRLKEYEIEEKKRGTNYQFCTNVKYPHYIDIYKGEEQLIIVPLITTIAWQTTQMAWHKIIYNTNDSILIGNYVFEALELIKNRWVDARTVQECKDDSIIKNATKCKSYKSFNKKYFLCGVILEEDGKLTISPTEKLDGNKGYGGNDAGLIYLTQNNSPEEIGNAVINCFKIMEESEKSAKSNKKKLTSVIETLSNHKISFEIPDLNRYNDEQDFHSAEIYQGYSFSYQNTDEPAAKLYFSIASELNNELQKDTIIDSFKKEYEEVSDITYHKLTNSFYECCTDIISKNHREIAYFKRIDTDELFSCKLILETKKLRKATISKIITDFNNLVESCRFITK
jgi:hypothetical protein